jgi:uncharacterized DUF497 family protein
MKQPIFIWDEKKNRTNQIKHGISFKEAQTVFYDENAILFYDDIHTEEEERYILLGFSDRARILIVCHLYIEKDTTIRIFSARKATKNEREYYFER